MVDENHTSEEKGLCNFMKVTCLGSNCTTLLWIIMANRDAFTLLMALVRPHWKLCAQFCSLHPRLNMLRETGEGPSSEDGEGPWTDGLQREFEEAELVQYAEEEAESRAQQQPPAQ